MSITLLDLSTLSWSLTGWRPFAWKLRKSAETGGFLLPDFGPFPARLPGSVQENLRRAGAIPDWNVGRNSLAIEWVEHRQWMFTTRLPALDLANQCVVLCGDTFDHSGWVLLDGTVVGTFKGAHLPTKVNLGDELARPGSHELSIVFDLPPEGQGQLGYTSLAREQKPRYSYSWDWCVRLVPIGIGGTLTLEKIGRSQVEMLGTRSSLARDYAEGSVEFSLSRDGVDAEVLEVHAVLSKGGREIATLNAVLVAGEHTYGFSVPHPELWWPQGEGAQPLYELAVSVRENGRVIGTWRRTVGFKSIEWRPCEGAPESALPWLCVVNGRPIFLQGVNWTPVRMCYLDTTPQETERLVGIYREVGCNLLRVWGGGYLETSEFYAACDRAGLLVWQEFPLSSSGIDSNPPRDETFIAEWCRIARHFIRSRQHHPCLLQWCGGNELQVEVESRGVVRRHPLDNSHPLLAALAAVVASEDPAHRFLPTSPFGPRFHSSTGEFGLGLHHEVHGPWGLEAYPAPGDWERYWQSDDALFRGETGVAGASSLALIQRQSDGEAVWPTDSLLWRHSSGWWTQWDRLGNHFAGLPDATALAAYVDETRREQAEKLAFAVRAKKGQFPRCGGFLIWMGHDAFPCLANTSLVEFDHSLKPAAHAVAAVFKLPAGK